MSSCAYMYVHDMRLNTQAHTCLQIAADSKQHMPDADAGKTEGQAWVVTPEGHEGIQPGWPASAGQTADQESSHDRPISLCHTPPQDPKAAMPDKRSLQTGPAHAPPVHGPPDQDSIKRPVTEKAAVAEINW